MSDMMGIYDLTIREKTSHAVAVEQQHVAGLKRVLWKENGYRWRVLHVLNEKGPSGSSEKPWFVPRTGFEPVSPP